MDQQVSDAKQNSSKNEVAEDKDSNPKVVTNETLKVPAPKVKRKHRRDISMNDVLPTVEDEEETADQLKTIQEFEAINDPVPAATDLLFNGAGEGTENALAQVPLQKQGSTFYSLIPPLLKFFDKLNKIDFQKALKRTRYNLIPQPESIRSHESLMITFIDFFTIPEIIKLKMLNSKTYNGNELTIF